MPAPVVHVVLPCRPKVHYQDLAGTTISRQTLDTYRVPPYLRRTLAGLGMALMKAKPELTYRTDRTVGKGKKGKPAPDGIEVRFPGRTTSEEVSERLRAAGYKFSSAQKMWYAYDTPENRAFAEAFAADEVEVDDAPTKTVHFWVVAKTVDELFKQHKSTWYNVEGKILKGRGYLRNYAPAVLENAVRAGRVKIHLFRDVAADETAEPGTEPGSSSEPIKSNHKVNSVTKNTAPAGGPASWTDAQWAEFHAKQAEKLQTLADNMSSQIEAKFNSGVSKLALLCSDPRFFRTEGFATLEEIGRSIVGEPTRLTAAAALTGNELNAVLHLTDPPQATGSRTLRFCFGGASSLVDVADNVRDALTEVKKLLATVSGSQNDTLLQPARA